MLRNTLTGEVRPITLEDVPKHKRTLWEAALPPEPPSIDEVRARALDALGAEIEDLRKAVASRFVTQNDVYQLKGALAVNAKRPLQDTSGLAGATLEEAKRSNATIEQARQFLMLEAEAVGETWDSLAEQIIARRDLWTELVMRLEAVRRAVSAAYDRATSSEQIDSLKISAADILSTIRAQAGV